MPDISSLSFDDLLPEEKKRQNVRALSFDDLVPNASTAADVGKSVLSALPKLAVGMAGLPMDLSRLLETGRSKLISYLPESMQRGAAVMDRIPRPTQFLAGLPGSQEFRSAIEDATGLPWHDPTTRAGKIADTATQTAALMGRNWLTNPAAAAAITGGITGGTEGAGALTNDDPWARLGGGLLGGGIPALFSAVRSRPGAVVRDAIGQPTPAQVDAAIALQNRSQQLGVPLMGTEALDRGHQLASAVYASPTGNQQIDAFLRARPQQVEQAANRDILAATGPRATPNANAARAQKAADAVITGLERARTRAVNPYYAAARTELMPAAPVIAVRQQIERAAAQAPESERGQYAPYIADLSASNSQVASTLDEIYQRARNAATLGINATGADKQAVAAAKVATPALEQLTAQSQNLSQGRKLYADYTRNQIEPVTSGPVGVIAGRTGFDPSAPSPVPRVISTVADASTARPETIKELYLRLNAKDPRAFPGVVQTHLENQLNTALGDLRSGPNPTAGAKFRDALVGTPIQRENFDEMMRGVAIASGAHPRAVVQGAHNLLEVLDRTGRTPGLGSPTATRGEVTKEMGKTMLGDIFSTVSLTPTKPLARRWDDLIVRARYGDIARALTAPDSVQQLVRLAKLTPTGLTAKYWAAMLLSGSGQ